MAGEPRLIATDGPEIEQIVSKRLKEQADTLKLAGIDRQIGMFNRQMRGVNKTLNELLGWVQALGIDKLTDAQKRAFPVVLADAARLEDKHQEEQVASKSRERFWQLAASVSMVLTVVVSLLSSMGVFNAIRLYVFHIK
jgi:ABC-type branched-subunit amino acid transport system substrate-binding protein